MTYSRGLIFVVLMILAVMGLPWFAVHFAQWRTAVVADAVNASGLLAVGVLSSQTRRSGYSEGYALFDLSITSLASSRVRSTKIATVGIDYSFWRHGFSSERSCEFSLSKTFKKEIQRQIGQTGDLRLVRGPCVIGGAHSQIRFLLPVVEFAKKKTGEYFRFRNIKLSCQVFDRVSDMQCRLSAPAVQWHTGGGDFAIKNIVADIKGRIKAPGFVIGPWELRAGEFLFQFSDGQKVSGDKLVFSYRRTLDGDKLSGDIQAELAALTFLKESFGPVHGKLEFKGVNFNALSALENKRIAKMADNISRPQLMWSLLNSVQQDAGQWLTYQPEIALRQFRAGPGQEAATARAKLRLNGNSQTNFFDIYQNISASVQVIIPAALVRRYQRALVRSRLGEHLELHDDELQAMATKAAEGFMQPWVDNGLFSKQADQYRLQASIEQGRLVVNANPVHFMIPMPWNDN